MGERILITGGAGFLGTSLAERLCERHDVVLLDSLRRNALAHTGLLAMPGVRLVRGDVLDDSLVNEAVRSCHRVVHMASVAGVSAVEADPSGTMQTTLAGTMHVLEACRRKGNLRRVVILSSSEVYGRRAEHAKEDQAILQARTSNARLGYAVSKLAAEVLGFSFHRQFGLPVTVIRPFNIYGPGQVGEGAVHALAERALSGLPLPLHNGGRQVRAWCYVDDLVDGLEQALFKEQAVGEVFNLGNPESAVTIQALAEMIVRLAGTDSALIPTSRPGAEVEVRIPDISKASRTLGFAPQVGLEDGLRRTLLWYRQHERIVEAADG